MVVALVRLYPSLAPNASPSSRLYAMLLPSADDATDWNEVDVQQSALGGFGLYPRQQSALDWSNVGEIPVLLPYLGMETVTKDQHSQKTLLEVLKGNFEQVTIEEVQRHQGTQQQAYIADGLFAVPRSAAGKGNPFAKAAPALPPSTRLLQVSMSADTTSGARPCACYLLAEEACAALNLTGERAHLFELLCAHARHEHADRHLATHVAMVHRKEEGYVLINAHPALADPLGITSLVNEPAGGDSPLMKMVQGYARLCTNDDELMRQRGLKQSAAAIRAWREHILPPVGVSPSELDLTRCSERMVMYASTRRAYACKQELTVDYGTAYSRDYASAGHRASYTRTYTIPKDVISTAHHPPDWPNLPGWFNPDRQPASRPAFARGADGAVRVCRDLPCVTDAARRSGNGWPVSQPATLKQMMRWMAALPGESRGRKKRREEGVCVRAATT